MPCTCKTRGVEILYGDSSVFCLGLSHGILTGLIMTHKTIPSELLSLKQYRCPTVYYQFYKVGECQKRKTCKNSYRPYSTLRPIKINLKVFLIHTFGRKKIQKHNYTQLCLCVYIYIYIYNIIHNIIYTFYIFFTSLNTF